MSLSLPFPFSSPPQSDGRLTVSGGVVQFRAGKAKKKQRSAHLLKGVTTTHILDQVAAIAATSKGTKLVVCGLWKGSQSQQAKHDLAIRRATEVYKYLEARRLPTDRIDVEAREVADVIGEARVEFRLAKADDLVRIADTNTLIVKKTITFKSGTAEIESSDSMDVIRSIAGLMRKHTSRMIAVSGLYRGRQPGQKKLAVDRASEVRKQLLANGVDGARVTTVTNEVARLDADRIRFGLCYTEAFLKAMNRAVIPVLPPPTSSRKTLALDLDETLVHAKRVGKKVRILVRPYAARFLHKMRRLFVIVIFTRAAAGHATRSLKLLDPKGTVPIAAILDKEIGGYEYNGEMIKDLHVLGRPLDSVLILENTASKYALHPENGVQIASWFGDEDDRELKRYVKLLKRLASSDVEDVRTELRVPEA